MSFSNQQQRLSKLRQALFTAAMLTVLIASIVFPSPVRAASRYYVRYNATGTGTGGSWTNAFTSLQSAINAAGAGDEIWVAAGTYYPTYLSIPADPRSATFRLKRGVRIYGGFAGNETLLTARDWVTNATILSGNIGSPTNVTDNAYHVVSINSSSSNANTHMDGFTIRDGRADGIGNGAGGGMIAEYGYGTYQNLVFMDNTASKGGGLYDYSGNAIQLNHVFFLNNSVTVNGTDTGDGGGLRLEESTSLLTDIEITNNTATISGGGMSVWKGNPTVDGVVFRGNSAAKGGGLFVGPAGDPIIRNATFENNHATESGGGAANFVSSAHYENATFRNNFVQNNALPGFGGAMEIYDCRKDTGGTVLGCPSILNSTFSSNTADNLGGAIMSEQNAAPTITNSLFYNNSAVTGGGAICSRDSSNPVITNTTFYGNSVTNVVSGIEGGAVISYQGGIPVITNSILWGNTPSQIWTGSGMTVTYSSIQGGYAGTGNINSNPMFVNAGAANFHLAAASPAIDAGNNAAVPAGVTLDMEGSPRFADMANKADTGVGDGPIVDFGPFEMQPANLQATFTSDKSVVDEGGLVNFTVTIENIGLGTATNVTVTDVLPPVFERSGTPVIVTNPVTTGNPGVGSIIAENIQLNHGGTATVTYALRALDGVVPPVPTTNTISVTANELDTPITPSVVITIHNLNPVVTVTGPFQADPFDVLNFHATITDPGTLDTIISYEWDFGDGSPTVGGSLDQTHAYSTTGIFIVTVRAMDKDGGVGVGGRTVFIAKYFQYFPLTFEKGKYK